MKPVLLVILDGWGIRKERSHNAVKLANTPNMDAYWRQHLSIELGASGLDVGLPEGQMGNSEVGHLNIGAGRVVYQDFLRIDKAIENNLFFKNQQFLKAINRVKEKQKQKLHLMGLIGPGGVHSHSRHLYALLRLAKQQNLSNDGVVIHCFLDGRDTPQKSALSYIEELENKIEEIGVGTISTVMGRYYAMDRDKRWDRTRKAYEAIINGKGKHAASPRKAIEKAYDNGETDEFVVPMIIDKSLRVKDGDSIIFFNFRPDRARQITQAVTDESFTGFERDKPDVYFVCMTQYDETFDLPVAFPPSFPDCTLGETVSKAGLKQLRIAETEKYAHVTFFFSGGREKPFEGEDRCLVPSPKISTYDLKPEMSAYKVTDEVIQRIQSKKFDMIVLNYANPDMVGHTGDLNAAIKACEAVDECLGKTVDAARKAGMTVLITGDHGNAENMLDQHDDPHTFHTPNPVPFILINDQAELRRTGKLADVAPTILNILGIDKPKEMTGNNLIIK